MISVSSSPISFRAADSSSRLTPFPRPPLATTKLCRGDKRETAWLYINLFNDTIVKVISKNKKKVWTSDIITVWDVTVINPTPPELRASSSLQPSNTQHRLQSMLTAFIIYVYYVYFWLIFCQILYYGILKKLYSFSVLLYFSLGLLFTVE